MPMLAKNLGLFADHWLFWSLYIRQSSAKRQTSEFTTDCKSLMCERNRTVPSSTPDSTLANKDDLPSIMIVLGK